MPAVGLERLWQQFGDLRDQHAREQLLIHYLPLVKMVAGRLKVGLPGSVEYGDLVSSGLMGLVSSLDNFSPQRGFKFETFAVPRIRGAMLDALREEDWLPRSVRQKSRQLDQAIEKLTAAFGRVPQDHEVAAELGLEGDDYSRFMEAAGTGSLLSLDARVSTGEDGESASLHDVIPDETQSDPLDALEKNDARELAKLLIAQLSEQEKAVVALYYYEELTFKEIGEVLGVSESRICQIHTRILATLRARLKRASE
jgi:RNA polymerase sigma factor FliA